MQDVIQIRKGDAKKKETRRPTPSRKNANVFLKSRVVKQSGKETTVTKTVVVRGQDAKS